MHLPICLLAFCSALHAQWWMPFNQVGGPGQVQLLDTYTSLLCPGNVCDRLTMLGRTDNFYAIGVPNQFSPTGYGTLRLGGTMEFQSLYQDPAWTVGTYWPIFVLNWRSGTVPSIGSALQMPGAMPLRDMLFVEPVDAFVCPAHNSTPVGHGGISIDVWSTFLTLPLTTYLLAGETLSAQHVHLGTMVLSNEWLVTITL